MAATISEYFNAEEINRFPIERWEKDILIYGSIEMNGRTLTMRNLSAPTRQWYEMIIEIARKNRRIVADFAIAGAQTCECSNDHGRAK